MHRRCTSAKTFHQWNFCEIVVTVRHSKSIKLMADRSLQKLLTPWHTHQFSKLHLRVWTALSIEMVGPPKWVPLVLKHLYTIQNGTFNIPSGLVGHLESRIPTFFVEMPIIWQKLVHRRTKIALVVQWWSNFTGFSPVHQCQIPNPIPDSLGS